MGTFSTSLLALSAQTFERDPKNEPFSFRGAFPLPTHAQASGDSPGLHGNVQRAHDGRFGLASGVRAIVIFILYIFF